MIPHSARPSRCRIGAHRQKPPTRDGFRESSLLLSFPNWSQQVVCQETGHEKPLLVEGFLDSRLTLRGARSWFWPFVLCSLFFVLCSHARRRGSSSGILTSTWAPAPGQLLTHSTP